MPVVLFSFLYVIIFLGLSAWGFYNSSAASEPAHIGRILIENTFLSRNNDGNFYLNLTCEGKITSSYNIDENTTKFNTYSLSSKAFEAVYKPPTVYDAILNPVVGGVAGLAGGAGGWRLKDLVLTGRKLAAWRSWQIAKIFSLSISGYTAGYIAGSFGRFDCHDITVIAFYKMYAINIEQIYYAMLAKMAEQTLVKEDPNSQDFLELLSKAKQKDIYNKLNVFFQRDAQEYFERKHEMPWGFWIPIAIFSISILMLAIEFAAWRKGYGWNWVMR